MLEKSADCNLVNTDKSRLATWRLTNNPKRIYEEFL